MQETTNYGLKKPGNDDIYNVEDFNDNMDAIDSKMKEIEEVAGASAALEEHIADKSNPHSVTKAQVGLSEVPNVSTNNQTPTYAVPSEHAALVSGEKLSVAMGKVAKAVNEVKELNDSLTANDGLNFNFVSDADGNYGFLDKDGEFMAFSGNKVSEIYIPTIDFTAYVTSAVTSGGSGGGSFSIEIGNLENYTSIAIASSNITISGYKSDGSTITIKAGNTDITDVNKIKFSMNKGGNSAYSSSYSAKEIRIK